MKTFVNATTSKLDVYPMERLFNIKKSLIKENKKVYDFGIGDPKLPLWTPIVEAVRNSVETTLGYPTIGGLDELYDAQKDYLKRRFNLSLDPGKSLLIPTRGSKEAIFHIALSLVGRSNKKTIAYPTPGYPVYESSALFCGATTYPINLNQKNNYRVEPWNLDSSVVKDLCALWVNYPHNPTGTSVNSSYWENLVSWCQKNDVVLLSDECYSDLYDHRFDSEEHKHLRPTTPLSFSTDKILSFFSLSKRSGFTGLRAGFIAGDINILKPHLKARANFGLASPTCIQKGATVAWKDDRHVEERRKILSERMNLAFTELKKLDMIEKKPEIPFYIWAKIPDHVKQDDITFCLNLAQKGVITTPARWLGSQEKNYIRFSLTQDKKNMMEAFKILQTLL